MILTNSIYYLVYKEPTYDFLNFRRREIPLEWDVLSFVKGNLINNYSEMDAKNV